MVTVVVDTSVWIDYLRGAATVATTTLRQRLAQDDPAIVMIEPVAMELLAGPTSEKIAADLTRLVDGLPAVALDGHVDYRSAAAIYRACRRAGRPVHNLSDCLIAAVAIRAGVGLVHQDADFDTIASVTPLKADAWR